MRNTFKRIISLLLCLTMTAGLLPSVSLFAGAEDVSYTYSFIKADYSGTEISYNGMPRYTDYSTPSYSETARNWKYLGMSDVTYAKWESSTGTNDGRSRAGFDAGGIRFTPAASSGEWFALTLRVPEPGLYKLSYMAPVNLTGLSENSTVSIFPQGTTKEKIKGLSNGPFTSGNLLAYKNVNFNSTEATSVERALGTNVFAINDDEVVVVVAFSASKIARFRGFKLTKVSDEMVTSAEELNFKAGDAKQALTVSLKNNTLQKSTGAEFSIDNEAVATVNAIGSVTPVAPGWTVLNVTLGDMTKKIIVSVADENGNVPGEKPSIEPVLSFPYEIIHIGQNAKIVNANSSYTYTSSDATVASVTADGTVTGNKIGRVTITATKGDIVKEFDVPVVGANLLVRNGIDHGHFENGIYFSDGSGTADKNKTFWEATKRDVEYVFDYAPVSVSLPGRADTVNAAKFTFDGNGTPGSNGRITLRVAAPASIQSKNSDRGMILAEDNKLYEFTGWYAAENTSVLGDLWHMLSYYEYADGTATEIRGQSIKPWDGKSGNQPWQMQTIPAVIINPDDYNQVWMRLSIQSVSAAKVGDILAAELSVHEVIYDNLKISAEKTEIEASETLTLSAKHYSNTGNEIKQMKSGKIVALDIPVTYESLNTEVIRVMDDKGTIIGVSDGTAKVRASATICGVTVSEEIEITVSGGTRPEFIGELALEIKGENIRPATYAVATVSATNENGDPMELDKSEVTFTSSNEAVANVMAGGIIRAKTVGETDITASITKNGLTKTATTKLTVVDYSPASALPEIIAARLVSDFVEVGNESNIVVTDMNGDNLGGGITYTYAIDDASIATLDGAIVTGKKVGKTYVTVTATLGDVTREARAPIAVVGSNLLIRYGVNHGEFENGIYLQDKSSDTPQYSSFWSAAHTEARGLFGYELLRGEFSEITGAPTNIVKFTMPDGLVSDNLKLIRVQGTTGAFSTSNGRHTGFVTADAKKLYEFTGYLKAQNAPELPENACGTMGYYNGTSSSATQLTNYKNAPWVGKTGDQDWTKFTINPVLMNWPNVKAFGLRPGFEAQTSDENPGYELYAAHMSLHEVVFDSIVFACPESFEGAATYDTFATSIKLLSNTGSQIVVGNTVDPIPVTYASTNETIAKIAEDGTITAISDGTCKVAATATVLGITKTAEIEVTFSGLDVMFDRVDVTCETELDVGEKTTVATTPRNTDDSDYTGELEIYFESSDTSVATITQEGVVTAKKSGETNITVYGIVGDRRVKTVIKVVVSDPTPLASASIRGASSVELGFTTKLTAEATHESGSPAKIDECEVVFALADESDASIVSLSADGSVKGIAEGTAKIIVTVTEKYGSTKTSAPFEIAVVPKSPKSKIFDFAQYPTNTSALLQTIENDGFEINRDLSSSTIVSGVIGNLRYLPASLDSRVGGTGHSQNSDTVIDFKIDYDGWYHIDFEGVRVEGASSAYIYMDNAYLGEYNFYQTEGDTTPTLAELNTMYLTAGVHQFTIRSMKSGDSSQASHTRYQRLVSVAFNYLGEELTINDPKINVDSTTLAVGETSSFTVDASLSDGRIFEFGNLKGNKADANSNLKITSSDSDVVEYKDGKIIAKKAGSAVITVKTLIYGMESENSVEITVTEETLSRIQAINAEGISLYVGETKDIELRAFVEGADSEEREVSIEDVTLSYALDSEVASVADRKITGTTVGEALLTVTSTLDGVKTLTSYIPIRVLADGYATAELSAVSQVLKFGGEGTDLVIKAYDNFGKQIDASNAEVVWTVSDSAIITVNESGRLLPGEVGVATVFATVTIDGITHKTNEVSISVRNGKVGSTYYTPERVAAARENIEKYDWAKSTAKTAITKADKWVEHYDTIYNLITNHTIPRTVYLGDEDDPDNGCCMYCGKHVDGKYAWKINAITRPWKVACGECSRTFPSNDFGAFYQRGLDEHGEFDRQLALEENGILCGRGERNEDGEYIVFDQFADNPYGYGDPNGNLYNKLYTELYTSGTDPYRKVPITQGWGKFNVGGDSGVPTVGHFWGVDDGLGYNTGRTFPNGSKEIHRYIALYNYEGLWYNHGNKDMPVVFASLTALRDAYLYTGDKKYARAGAIILDRVADLYPDFNYGVDCEKLVTSGKGRGKISGYIHENFLNRALTTAYDAFFDIYDDPQVIKYLSEKAAQWNLDNKKTDGELLRQNVEENLLMETYLATARGWIRGNFGMKKDTVTKAAVILDREPDTSEMIDFVMRAGTTTDATGCTGCGLYEGIMNRIDRDGYGDEGSLSYIGIFSGSFIEIINTLSYYGKVDPKYDLINNPKVIASFTLGADTIIGGYQNANIGDASGTFGGNGKISSYQTQWLLGLQVTENPLFAQLLYLTNGNSSKGLKYDIFTKNPEEPETLVQEMIDKYGEFDLARSDMLTGYGFASLRGGVKYNNVTEGTRENTMRDWWMYFGGGDVTTHKHREIMNLGVTAFGLNMAPDHGYGGSGGLASQGNNVEYWFEGTLSHNTVMVNDVQQIRSAFTFPQHYEDAGSVQIMDVDAPQAYKGVTDTYRRTVVSVDIDDSVSYALDFFRIVGGNEHLYSFHSMAEESVVDGVELVRQPQGSYAGVEYEVGDIYYEREDGFNCLENVERAVYPDNRKYSIDFQVKDYRKVLKGNRDIHLKLTQLNDFDASEVVRAEGLCIDDKVNPRNTDYFLVRRSGENLDTLFTSVIEPYENESKMKSIERVNVARADGGVIRESDAVAAVKVELTNGRTDYVVYSARNDVEYIIDDLFNFCGFVGVYSVNAEDSSDVVRTYLHDGTKLGDVALENAAIEGEVVDFTNELNYNDGKPILENYLEMTANCDVDPQSLVGKMLVVDNDQVENGAYIIRSAEKNGDNYILGMGDVSFFRGLADDNESFVWNIERGQKARVALSSYADVSPKIYVTGEYTTSAGSSITIPIKVESDREYELIATMLPRGMVLDTESEKLMWTPTSSQIGDNHVAVTVDNGVLSKTLHFNVTVYGSTTGGNGGGASGAPSTPGTSAPTIPATPGADKPGSTTPTEPSTPVTPETDKNVRFIDLGNHAWAEDAINSLADEGIIRGTSENTFSPAANITRADFAILLVRAFKLASENEENFADVADSDYFAKELAIARNTGLVNGIGDNKFAPKNNITRQDMMVIVYRALVAMEKEFDTAAITASDFADVADYAKDAVSALVNAKLINGKSGLIDPTANTTRAEVAVFIERILDYIK